jgi:hypothetical protein
VKPTQMRECVQLLQVGFRVSERYRVLHHRDAPHAVSLSQPRSGSDAAAAAYRRIGEIAAVRVRYGYRRESRVHTLLRREGWPSNRKRVGAPDRLLSARRALAATQGAQEAGQCAMRRPAPGTGTQRAVAHGCA